MHTKQLTQTKRVTRSRFTGKPMIERLHGVWGYYESMGYVSEAEYAKLMSDETPAYSGPKHPAQLEAEAASHLV